MTISKQETIEVITSVQRRRRWTPNEKRTIVQETYEPGKSVSSVARQRGIIPSQLFYWRRRMEDGALTGVGSEERVVPESQIKELELRIRQLERVLVADFTSADPRCFHLLTPGGSWDDAVSLRVTTRA